MPRAERKKQLPIVAGPPHTVCAMLGIRDDDIRPAINSGEIPSYKLGLRRRIFVADAERWLRSRPPAQPRARGPHG